MTHQHTREPELPAAEADPFDRFTGPNDELLFRLGFRAALRVCEIANFTFDTTAVDVELEG